MLTFFKRFFQIHFVTKGAIHIFLDDVKYVCKAPVCFLPPPAVTHLFMTDPLYEAHVLTVQQNLIWPLRQVDLKVQNAACSNSMFKKRGAASC